MLLSEKRKRMAAALKKIVVQKLRDEGFKGSFPHFRRFNENNIDLITFQFNRWGGSFVVELASCPKEGTTMSWGEKIPPNKVTAHDMNERYRLGANSLDEDGKWFDYEHADAEDDYLNVAATVAEMLNTSDPSWISSLLKE